MKDYEIPYIEKKMVSLIVVGYVGKEAEAIRSTLEYFNYRVDTHWIGSKNELKLIFSGGIKTNDILIICCHGSQDGFIIDGEPSFTVNEINDVSKLLDKIILSNGCLTGRQEISEAIIDCGASAYIAPTDYIDGNTSLLFINHLFYFLSKGDSLKEAYQKSHKFDQESSLFKMFDSNYANLSLSHNTTSVQRSTDE